MNQDPRKWNWVHWQKANTIPCDPGCYALLDSDDKILYIGRSKILWNRLRNPSKHRGFKRATQEACTLKIAWCVGWDIYNSEKVLIKQWNPPLCQDHINGRVKCSRQKGISSSVGSTLAADTGVITGLASGAAPMTARTRLSATSGYLSATS